MKALRITAVILAAGLAFSACGKEEKSSKAEKATPTVTVDNNGYIESVLKKYCDEYQTTLFWQDCFVSQKYVFVNNEYVISVLAIENAEQITKIKLSSIERITQSNIADYTQIKVFDKTNTSIDIYLNGEASDALIKCLE